MIMKIKTIALGVLLCSMALLPVSGKAPFKPVNPEASKEARNLLKHLYKISGKQIISGQHHFPDRYYQDADRIFEMTDRFPLMWGCDMAWSPETLVEEAIRQYKSGHVITLMWHAARPMDTGRVDFSKQTQGPFSEVQWEELMTEGSEMQRGWIAQADAVAEHLKILRDHKIPVLWRPYHEMNGEWFWWGDRKGENGFVKLWKMLYDRFTKVHHLDNLLWVWNANGPRTVPDTAYAYHHYFPGIDYVDILATDIYHGDYKQSHHDELLDLGQGKPIALGEIGAVPSPEVLATQNRYVWFMIWARFMEAPNNTPEAVKALYHMPQVMHWEK